MCAKLHVAEKRCCGEVTSENTQHPGPYKNLSGSTNEHSQVTSLLQGPLFEILIVIMVGRVSYAYQCAICPLPTVTKIVQSTGAYRVNSQTMRSVMQLDTNDVCTS